MNALTFYQVFFSTKNLFLLWGERYRDYPIERAHERFSFTSEYYASQRVNKYRSSTDHGVVFSSHTY